MYQELYVRLHPLVTSTPSFTDKKQANDAPTEPPTYQDPATIQRETAPTGDLYTIIPADKKESGIANSISTHIIISLSHSPYLIIYLMYVGIMTAGTFPLLFANFVTVKSVAIITLYFNIVGQLT